MKRLSLIAVPLALAALAALASPAVAEIRSQFAPDTDGVDTDGDGIVDNDHVKMHLAAGDGWSKMPDGRRLYTFGFSDQTGVPDGQVMMDAAWSANWPGPTIVLKEGQKFYLNLSNVGMLQRPDLFDAHTVHFHGFPNAAPVFDGEPMASFGVNMGSSLTYFYSIVQEGTFIYHCHMEATEHMQMGMLAQLHVEPKQNMLPDGTVLKGFVHRPGNKYAYNDGDGSTYYDVEASIQLAGFDPRFHDEDENVQPLSFALLEDTYHMYNGRGYPETMNPDPIANDFNGYEAQKHNAIVRARQGQKILLRLSSVSTTDNYTVRVLGIPMRIVAKDAVMLRGSSGRDLSVLTTTVTMGGGETYDVLLDTATVAPGTYIMYTTNLYALSNDKQDFGGQMTEIVVTP